MASKNFRSTCVFVPCYLTDNVDNLYDLPVVLPFTVNVFRTVPALRRYYADNFTLYDTVHAIQQSCVYADSVVDFIPLLRGTSSGLTYGYVALTLV